MMKGLELNKRAGGVYSLWCRLGLLFPCPCFSPEPVLWLLSLRLFFILSQSSDSVLICYLNSPSLHPQTLLSSLDLPLLFVICCFFLSLSVSLPPSMSGTHCLYFECACHLFLDLGNQIIPFFHTIPPFFSLSSPTSNNSKPAIHLTQLPHRANWLNLGLQRGETIWKDSERSCGGGGRQALSWHWIGRNILGATWKRCRICSQTATHRHTHTRAHSHTLSGGLETVWECISLRFPK